MALHQILPCQTKLKCQNFRYCTTDSLDSTKVRGKILLCDMLNDGEPAVQAGAAGIVMQGDEHAKDFAVSFPLPATFLSANDGRSVFNYIKLTRY